MSNQKRSAGRKSVTGKRVFCIFSVGASEAKLDEYDHTAKAWGFDDRSKFLRMLMEVARATPPGPNRTLVVPEVETALRRLRELGVAA